MSAAFVARGLYGAVWRLLVVTAGILEAHALHLPLAWIAGGVMGGVILGLWHRRWGVARIWRWTVVAIAVGELAPLLSVQQYGQAVAGAVALAVLAPWRRALMEARR